MQCYYIQINLIHSYGNVTSFSKVRKSVYCLLELLWLCPNWFLRALQISGQLPWNQILLKLFFFAVVLIYAQSMCFPHQGMEQYNGFTLIPNCCWVECLFGDIHVDYSVLHDWFFCPFCQVAFTMPGWGPTPIGTTLCVQLVYNRWISALVTSDTSSCPCPFAIHSSTPPFLGC